jgi:phosphomannomutase / phosphoglucomutase
MATVGLPSRPGIAARLFGTDGIRKVVGTEINPVFIAQVISAYARGIDGPGPVLIAHDFRTTSDGLARICAGTLQMNGVDVYEMGVMPTPCLQFNVKNLNARGGLMITASHNPTEFNGIKFAGPDGLEISREVEEQIEKGVHERGHRYVGWDSAGHIRLETRGVERYLASILRNVDRDRIRAARPRVILDCGNGTSAVTSPQLLSSLGTQLKTLNANPDGGFPGHPSEPSDENLSDLKKAVVEFGASLGIAHDGDSDRIAFIDEKGRYVPGEVTLALFAQDLLRSHPGATIATSITSSSAIEDVVRAEGGKLIVTRSGSLPVAIGVAEHQAIFGGEENGHYYWPEHQNAADGPMSSAKLIELLVRTDRPLSELVNGLPKYVVVKQKVPLPPEVKAAVMEEAQRRLTAETDRVITIDGIKAFFPEGWLLVRPSGTEPICRVFAESRTADGATKLIEHGKGLVNELVASVGAPSRKV